jgi:microcin C transport system substrate-binding protein
MSSPKNTIAACVAALIFGLVLAQNSAAQPGLDPFASPNAKKGGSFTMSWSDFPKSLNFYLDNNTFTVFVFSSLFDSLIQLDPVDESPIPSLAKSWEISPDKKVFTFHLDPAARWSDGKPVTADDVIFTYDTLMNPKNLTSLMRIYLSRFDKPERLDGRTVRFKAHTVHWGNFIFFSGFQVLPRHGFEGKDFNKQNFDFPVVSGAYRMQKVDKGQSIELARRPGWWAAKQPFNRGKYNFDLLRFRMSRDHEVAFESFKKGDLDFYEVNVSKLWHTETDSEKFQKNWIIKQRIYNQTPPIFQGFAMNARRPLFKDVRVRKALAYALDRKTLIEKLMYNEYYPINSYFTHIYDSRSDIPMKPLEYNLDKARALLREAGWSQTDSEGYLVKGGKRFEFVMLERDQYTENILTIYQEVLKKLGIKMDIEITSVSTWFKRVSEYDYDMTFAGWLLPVLVDPEDAFSAKQADEKAGNNITGFKNAEVDRMIEELKPIFDVKKRNQILRRMDRIIFDEHPYVLLWGTDNIRILYWNKFGKPKNILTRYSDLSAALAYWWYDPQKDKALSEAMAQGLALPPEPAVVHVNNSGGL